MAKSKKQSGAQPAGEQPAPAAKAGGKKAGGPKAKSAPATSAGTPMIDTSLAAAAAARMVANRDLLNTAGPKKESGSFKQLKENLNKPAVTGPASFLQSTAPQKKSNLPFGGRNQVGHNQTFGADVNRSGVPRRTGG
jgi:hypothetical protein